MLIDSHCHLQLLEKSAEPGAVDAYLERAKLCGVKHFLCVCTHLNQVPLLQSYCQQYPFVYASIGVHPNEELTAAEEPGLEKLIEAAKLPKILAIGETGLDYYRLEGTTNTKENQHARFRRHIQAGIATKKPLIIHTRKAPEDTLTILKEEKAYDIGGVFHCFTENYDTAKAALDLNFYISFSGIVTFKNAKPLQEIAKQIPLDRILIETDAPYLAPEPHRGKSNEPAFLRDTAQFIAMLKGVSFEEVASSTTENYLKLFKPV